MKSVVSRIGQRIGLIALGVVIAGLAGEAVLRIPGMPVARHSDWMFLMVEYDPLLGWRMRRNIEVELDMFDVQDIPIRTNGAGFWDKEFTEAGSEGMRIALVGDSFTWGSGVHRNERFGEILEQRNAHWDCMNFGLPAYGTDQALLTWRHVVSALSPDLVVLTIHTSDYEDNMHEIRWGRPKSYFLMNEDGTLELKNSPVTDTNFWDNGILHAFAPPYRAYSQVPVIHRSRVAHWLVKRSDLARCCWNALSAIRARPRTSEPTAPAELTPFEEEQVRLLTTLVGQLRREVESADARLLVLIAGRADPRYDAQMKAFDRQGIAYLDVTTDPLSRELGIAPDEVYFTHHGHWSPAGQRGVAELLRRKISESYEEAPSSSERGTGL